MTDHEHEGSTVLCGQCKGEWAVTTLSGSTYLIDLDAMTQERLTSSAELRGDGKPIKLVAIDPVRPGYNMRMVLDGLAEEGVTVRTTNLVTEVLPVRTVTHDLYF